MLILYNLITIACYPMIAKAKMSKTLFVDQFNELNWLLPFTNSSMVIWLFRLFAIILDYY